MKTNKDLYSNVLLTTFKNIKEYYKRSY